MRLPRFRARNRPLSEWFTASHDDSGIRLNVAPPGQQAWSASVPWNTIERVCVKCEGMSASDGIYLFTSARRESFAVPTEATGGLEILDQLVRRKLFPAELAIEAAGGSEGDSFCWPAE